MQSLHIIPISYWSWTNLGLRRLPKCDGQVVVQNRIALCLIRVADYTRQELTRAAKWLHAPIQNKDNILNQMIKRHSISPASNFHLEIINTLTSYKSWITRDTLTSHKSWNTRDTLTSTDCESCKYGESNEPPCHCHDARTVTHFPPSLWFKLNPVNHLTLMHEQAPFKSSCRAQARSAW